MTFCNFSSQTQASTLLSFGRDDVQFEDWYHCTNDACQNFSVSPLRTLWHWPSDVRIRLKHTLELSRCLSENNVQLTYKKHVKVPVNAALGK